MSTSQTNQTSQVSPRPLALNLFNQYPTLRDRLARGVGLYKAGCVATSGAYLFTVTSLDGERHYTVARDLSSCSCPDHQGRNGTFCKHLVSVGLMLASYELAQGKLPTLAKVLRQRFSK